jgi:1-acyl-sn-glycerol-3-phosphate acyltransferase
MIHAVKKHEISVMAKKELLKHKPLDWFFKKMHCIPVDRGNSDMAAMRASVKVLREGGVLGIFPEGTRYHKGVMEELEGGAALLALRSGVPVVPMYITAAFGFFRRLHCYVGKPVPFQDLKEQGINAETCQKLNERITALYADMVAAHSK